MRLRDSLPLVLVGAGLASSVVAACGDDTSGGGGSGSGSGGAAATSTSGATTTATTSGSSSASSSASGTGGEGGAPPVVPTPPADPTEPWDRLADWNLFVDAPAQVPADRVVFYDVIAPLFSDEAVKLRFLHVPEGAAIAYADEGPWGFPEGTVLVKTFAYPEDATDPDSALRLVETRLLWRLADGWKPLTYVWNEDGTEAERTSAGDTLPVAWTDEDGEARELDYVVPNTNQCKECHSQDEELETLGGFTLQLDREQDGENQIDRLDALGFFEGAPTPAEGREHLVDPFGDEDLVLRARSYLHANCSSCHKDGGTASQSGLLLDWASNDPETDPANVGICKIPTSAGGATCGLTFDVVPGDPDASILICRISSEDTEVRMPPLARQLVDEDGVALLRELIEALPPADCE